MLTPSPATSSPSTMMSPTLMPIRSRMRVVGAALGFARDEIALDVERALQRGRCARELGEESVARRLHETAAVRVDLRLRDGVAQMLQPREGRRLVALHQATEAGDVGHHDRRELASGRLRCHEPSRSGRAPVRQGLCLVHHVRARRLVEHLVLASCRASSARASGGRCACPPSRPTPPTMCRCASLPFAATASGSGPGFGPSQYVAFGLPGGLTSEAT